MDALKVKFENWDFDKLFENGSCLSGGNNENNGFGGCICMRENGKMELWV